MRLVVFLVLIKLIKLKLFCWTTMTLFLIKICIKILIVTMWSQLYCICSILLTAIFLVWKQIHSIFNQSTTSIYIMCTFKCFTIFFELAGGLCLSLFINITFQPTYPRIQKTSFRHWWQRIVYFLGCCHELSGKTGKG